jgi:hypothetical protein
MPAISANYGDFGFDRVFPALARPLTLWQGSAALKSLFGRFFDPGTLP